MTIRKSLLALFVYLSFSNVNAQDFKLGKVTVAELQEKECPNDPTAVAAILFKKGDVKFEYLNDTGFNSISTVTIRIKIYKQEGLDWSNQEVNFREGSSREKVTFTDAVTYNLVDGKIEKTKLKGEGEFEQNINKFWSKKKITMPNVKVGSVIEYKYIIKSKNIGVLRDWDFQTKIPVNYSEYKTFIPEYFIYSANQKGFVFPKKMIEKHQQSIIINGVTSKDGSVGGPIFSNGNKLDFEETQTTYIAENIPAMKEEAYVNNINNYSSTLSQELSMTKYPNENLKPYSTNWNAVVKTIYEYEDFGPELNKTGYFEDDLKGVIAGLTTPQEKIEAIFNYVKTTIKWSNYLGYSCDNGVKKAYKDKIGNIAEINLMLTAMLRYAGLNANPVLVSTRSNGIALFPNRTAFNYVIAAVENQNNLLLLDASDKFSAPNVLPFRALNWMGRLIRKDGTSTEVDLMPKNTSNNTVMMNYSIGENGVVSGKLRRQLTDYLAMIFRVDNENLKEDNYLEKLENENKKIEISEYSRGNDKDVKLPVVETFSFSGSNFSENIAGKIYLNPMLFFTKEQNPFKQETREYPVDFGYTFSDKYVVNVKIPDGYKIETLPASAAVTMEENLGSFKYTTKNSEDTILLTITLQINTSIISSEYYSMLKEFYQAIVDKETEKIILTKI
jgi:hypothetical protein